jgi:hypothetical protein
MAVPVGPPAATPPSITAGSTCHLGNSRDGIYKFLFHAQLGSYTKLPNMSFLMRLSAAPLRLSIRAPDRKRVRET